MKPGEVWVDKEGRCVVTPKNLFLGLEYDPKKDKLIASTKKGSRLGFDKSDFLSALAACQGVNKKSIKGLGKT